MDRFRFFLKTIVSLWKWRRKNEKTKQSFKNDNFFVEIVLKNGRFQNDRFQKTIVFKKLVVSLTIINDKSLLMIVNDDPSLTIVHDDSSLTIVNEERRREETDLKDIGSWYISLISFKENINKF